MSETPFTVHLKYAQIHLGGTLTDLLPKTLIQILKPVLKSQTNRGSNDKIIRRSRSPREDGEGTGVVSRGKREKE